MTFQRQPFFTYFYDLKRTRLVKRLVVIFLCLFSVGYFVACKKKKSAAVAVTYPLTFPAYADLPYDTTFIDAVFSANILFDSTKAHREYNIYFATWFTQKVSAGFIDSVVINANSLTLGGAGYYLSASFNQSVPPVGFSPDTSVAWSMTGITGYDFTYTNTDSFPTYNVYLPDTISKGRNNTFVFNATTVLNADTVLLKLIIPQGKDTTTLRYYASPTTGSIVIDPSLISSITGRDVGVIVSVFNHEPLTVNGYKYLFVKEYSFGRNVWFK